MWNPRTYHDTDFGLADGESFEPDTLEEEISTGEPHIMTLLGPIPPAELGICLPHVHLLSDPPDVLEDFHLNDADRAEAEIETFVTMNGRSLVDGATADTGRDVASLLNLAGWVPAHLLGVTGRHSHRFASRMTNALDVDSLAQELIADLTEGMDGTTARAGLIEVAVGDDRPTDVEMTSLIAAALAHEQTGASVTTFTEVGTHAIGLVQRLALTGVAADRVIVGHVDRVPMSDHALREILATGAYIQFDQIGLNEQYTDQQRAERIFALCEQGFASQILLSLDYDRRSQQIAWGGGPGFSYLSEWFMVQLMEVGLDTDAIRRLVVENPAAALTIVPPGVEG